jgi:hypothetical protein
MHAPISTECMARKNKNNPWNLFQLGGDQPRKVKKIKSAGDAGSYPTVA